eukprot:scaffold6879_cov63-Cylindrotheca_fusiformis.AAC.1
MLEGDPNKGGSLKIGPEEEVDHQYDHLLNGHVPYSITRRWRTRGEVWKEHCEKIEVWMDNVSDPIPPLEAFKLQFCSEHPIFAMLSEFEKELTEYRALHDDSTFENEIQTFENEIQTLEAEIRTLEAEMQTLQNEMQSLQSDLERHSEESNDTIIRRIIEGKQGSIKHMQGSIMHMQGSIKHKQVTIKNQRERIIKNDLITLELEMVYRKHDFVRYQLQSLKDRGRSGVPWYVGRPTEESAPTEEERVDSRIDVTRVSSSEYHLLVNPRMEPQLEDELTNLVNKESLENLSKFQKFVAALVGTAPSYDKEKDPQRAKHLLKTVKHILAWDPNNTEEINFHELVRPSFTNNDENDVERPILRAILLRIVQIVGLSQSLTTSEQSVPSLASRTATSNRQMDRAADEISEYVARSLLPATLGRAIQINAVSEKKSKFERKLWKADNEVLRQLEKQASFFFDIGGVGADCELYGISLTLWSVSVERLELREVGTKKARVQRKKNTETPPFGKGLPFATGLPGQEVVMGQKPRMVEVMKDGVEKELNIERLLGSGSFSNVLQLQEIGHGAIYQFLKIPKMAPQIVILEREAKVLSELNHSGRREDIPQLVKESSEHLSMLKFFSKNDNAERNDCGETLLAVAARRRGRRKLVGNLVLGVFRALEHVHEKGYAHLYIKPENVMVDSMSGKVMVSDWGLASKLGKEIPYCGSVPYSHDSWFPERTASSPLTLQPTADFDYAGLLYTWVQVAENALKWQDEFRKLEFVDARALAKRRQACEEALLDDATYRNEIPDDVFWKLINGARLNIQPNARIGKQAAESGIQQEQETQPDQKSIAS